MIEPNHRLILQQIDEILRRNPVVHALLLVGSVARAAADRWSDLDVIVVVADDQMVAFTPATLWITALGKILAVEQYPGAGRATTRAWLTSGRVDVVVATESCFGQEDDWPLWNGVVVCFSRSPIVNRVIAHSQQRPALQLLISEDFDSLANQFWFHSLMALTKVVRGHTQPAWQLPSTRWR